MNRSQRYQRSFLVWILIFCIVPTFHSIAGKNPTKSGKKIYQELNQNKKQPFVLSIGTALSHTHHANNTAHPNYLRMILQKQAQQEKNPRVWLEDQDRIGYVKTALPIIECTSCKRIINPDKFDTEKDHKLLSHLLDDIVNNLCQDKLTITKCPFCAGDIIEREQPAKNFTPDFKNHMLDQISYLGINKQKACTDYGLPNYRLSLDVSDVLHPHSKQIDPSKVEQQAKLLKEFGNPLVFFHHYENPQVIENLFQDPQHVHWFANYCGTIIEKSPQITHVCPISQPSAFVFRTIRQSLPPFTAHISEQQFMKNVTQAQVAASKKMKSINPHLKVLISHQWKLFKPKHEFGDPRQLLERFICKIANNRYNGNFIKMLQPHQEDFDGIALSLYPVVRFDLWTPLGDNRTPYFNENDALEAIMQTHKAFPNKEIFIVETGCNTLDPVMKKDFIDMTLRICQIARQQGVDIKGVYFWEQTNDTQHWYQWNQVPRPLLFAPYDGYGIDSINSGGLHIKEILE